MIDKYLQIIIYGTNAGLIYYIIDIIFTNYNNLKHNIEPSKWRIEMSISFTMPITMVRPPLVEFGEGALEKLSPWVKSKSFLRPFIIADEFNAARVDALGLNNASVFGSIKAEPDIQNLVDAVKSAKESKADLIVGFGGGSAMDVAKLVAVLIDNEMELTDISGPNRAPERSVGLVQIPTTAGTGSEAGTRALVTDTVGKNKIATESPHMLADLAIIDPKLTETVPSLITAATGVDAMAHCVEAYTSKRSHPIIDSYAIQGIELVGRYLKRAVEDGADYEARAGLSLASFYGGICLGPVNTTAGHAVSYPLGTNYNLAHGLANALIFPSVLAFNFAGVPEKTKFICQALGFENYSSKSIREGAMNFCSDLGLDMQLRAYNIPENALEHMAKEAHAIRRLLDWNPVDLQEEDIFGIYKSVW